MAVAASVVYLGALLLTLAGSAPVPSASSFLIDKLPGLATPPSFKQYSGFMPLGDQAGTHLFFWFCESQRSPTTDPLLYWTNGGPGSSSVAYGFWTEHGPFRLAQNGTVVEPYQFSWNQKASVLYVEQPSGVGLSWSADQAHYSTNDQQASADNLLFLKAFFRVFPEFQRNEFYVTGESYGGHYVPQLAMRILEDPVFEKSINMQGFFIGNPGINSDWYYNINEYAFLTFMYSHALLPQKQYHAAWKACNWNSFIDSCGVDFTHPTVACVNATHEAWTYLPRTWDPYNVLVGTCHEHSGPEAREARLAADAFVSRTTPFLAEMRRRHGLEGSMAYDPCITHQTPLYMRRPDVLKAIHADSHPNPVWPSDRPGWNYGDETEDIALLFPKFAAQAPHWKIAVVSGTADAAVPFIGTERWMECLGREVVEDWKLWTLHGDVAGAVKTYAPNMQFISVKGCGHTIPTYCPEPGFVMLDNWLSNNWPPQQDEGAAGATEL